MPLICPYKAFWVIFDPTLDSFTAGKNIAFFSEYQNKSKSEFNWL
jgi:hypothetical protein